MLVPLQQSRSHISVSHYVFIAAGNKRIVQNSDKGRKKLFAEERLKIIV
jgi:hypothetical protein